MFHVTPRAFAVRITLVLTAVTVTVVGVGLFVFHRLSWEANEERLQSTVVNQAALMESVARFDAFFLPPGDGRSSTLSQIREAYREDLGLGRTGELVLAERVDSQIVFVLPQRKNENRVPAPTPLDARAAEPMRLALSGASGTIVGIDYAGDEVLAAYEYLPFLEMGLVAKIDTAEIRAPFRTALAVTVGIALVMILLGSLLSRATVGPLFRQIVSGARELEVARDEADAANTAKSAFLASMSHEIRTPMNAILGFSQMMQRDASLDATHRDRVDTIVRSGEHLLDLINDILDMSKIEAGSVELAEAPFDPRGLLRDVEAMFASRASEKGLQLEVEADDELPRYLLGDAMRVRQVLVNLVGNGIKFTEEGGISVHAGVVGRSGDSVRVRFDIIDTGVGIEASARESIFEAFEQSDAGRNVMGGTGLGLPISREFARMMGGDITLESEVGRGSRFRVEIPFEVTDEAPASETAAARPVVGLAEGSRVPRMLVVDDKEANRALLAALLEEVGIEVETAEDGLLAVDAVSSGSFDLVFMDMKMPGIDGLEATARIRRLEGGADLPIVIVSASVFDEHIEETLKGGIDAFIRKPFRTGQVFDEIERLTDIRFIRRAPDAAPGGAPAPPSPARLTADSLAEVDAATRTRLADAAVACDLDALAVVCDELADDGFEQVDALRRLVDGFDFEAIERLASTED